MPDTEPRTWREGDPEPGADVRAVQNQHGVLFIRRPWPVPYGRRNATTVWQNGPMGDPHSWEALLGEDNTLVEHLLPAGEDCWTALRKINNQGDPSARSTRETPPPVPAPSDSENASQRPDAGQETAHVSAADYLMTWTEHIRLTEARADAAEAKLAETTAQRDEANRDIAQLQAMLHSEHIRAEKAERDLSILRDSEAIERTHMRLERERDEARAKLDQVRAWADAEEARTREWDKDHNTECECEVAQTTYELIGELRKLLPVTDREEPAQATPVIDRCNSCEHPVEYHSEDGCWFSVRLGKPDKNTVCPCRVERTREASEEPAGETKPPLGDGGEYIREYYGVPAEIGRKILFEGKPGEIVGFDTSSARMYAVGEFGNTEPVMLHPTWEVEYLDDTGRPVERQADSEEKS